MTGVKKIIRYTRDFDIESHYINVPLYKHRNLQYMYMYLEYKSTATIGQWWNVSNHSGNIQIDTVTNKGNNSTLLCDYVTQCNYHSSYFSQSLNCSRGHYFTAINSFWKLLWLLSISQNNINIKSIFGFCKEVICSPLKKSQLIDCIPITE